MLRISELRERSLERAVWLDRLAAGEEGLGKEQEAFQAAELLDALTLGGLCGFERKRPRLREAPREVECVGVPQPDMQTGERIAVPSQVARGAPPGERVHVRAGLSRHTARLCRRASEQLGPARAPRSIVPPTRSSSTVSGSISLELRECDQPLRLRFCQLIVQRFSGLACQPRGDVELARLVRGGGGGGQQAASGLAGIGMVGPSVRRPSPLPLRGSARRAERARPRSQRRRRGERSVPDRLLAFRVSARAPRPRPRPSGHGVARRGLPRCRRASGRVGDGNRASALEDHQPAALRLIDRAGNPELVPRSGQETMSPPRAAAATSSASRASGPSLETRRPNRCCAAFSGRWRFRRADAPSSADKSAGSSSRASGLPAPADHDTRRGRLVQRGERVDNELLGRSWSERLDDEAIKMSSSEARGSSSRRVAKTMASAVSRARRRAAKASAKPLARSSQWASSTTTSTGDSSAAAVSSARVAAAASPRRPSASERGTIAAAPRPERPASSR